VYVYVRQDCEYLSERQHRHIDREVRVSHHAGERIPNKVGSTPAREIKGEMVFGIVERPEERNALDVVQVKMAEENMGADGLAAELLLEFFAKQPDAGPPVEDEDLVAAGADLNTGGVAAIHHIFSLGCWRRTSHSPKPHTHSVVPQSSPEYKIMPIRLQGSWEFEQGFCSRFL